jgi:hypothetical protein
MVVATAAQGNLTGKKVVLKKLLNSNTNKLTYNAAEISLPSPLKTHGK